MTLETPLDSQVVLETVPYSDAVAPIHSEAALDAFLRLHPAGSSRPNGDLNSLAAHVKAQGCDRDERPQAEDHAGGSAPLPLLSHIKPSIAYFERSLRRRGSSSTTSAKWAGMSGPPAVSRRAHYIETRGASRGKADPLLRDRGPRHPPGLPPTASGAPRHLGAFYKPETPEVRPVFGRNWRKRGPKWHEMAMFHASSGQLPARTPSKLLPTALYGRLVRRLCRWDPNSVALSLRNLKKIYNKN